MSDYKSGWPPPPPGQAGPPATAPMPMAPPRSVPPAATPQRIPVPLPQGTSVPPKPPSTAAPEANPVPAQEPVDLDAEVMEAPDDDAEEPVQEVSPAAAEVPESAQAVPVAPEAQVLEPLRPMRRLSIAEPGTSSNLPSAPPPHPELALASPPPPPLPAEGVGAPAVTAEGEAQAPAAQAPAAQAPPAVAAVAAPVHDRLPSFDDLPSFADPEHEDGVVLGTPAPPQLVSSEPAADPDEVDTPIPAAPVHVSAPPPFVPPPSPLLPDFTGVPPLDPAPRAAQLALSAPPPLPITPPPAPPSGGMPSAEAAEAEPQPERRPSRPPPVVPDAVVAAMQPESYQTEAAFETHAPLDDEEMRLSETDLEISVTGEPPEVDMGEPATQRGPQVTPAAPPPAAEARAPEAPVPDVSSGPASEGATAPTSDGKKPPPPKRTAKPALPSATIRRRPWWETLFGDDFARAHRSPTPRQLAHEVNFMVTTLALAQNQVVLDLGCGQGEHAVELTRRGVSVVGYDLSVFQLAMAGDRAQQEGQKINFLQGDMREMAFDAMFDAIVCWDTTFGYFEEEKNVDVARRILAALKPGGSLLLHVMNRDFAAKESPTNIWFEGDGCVCMDDVDFDWITSRLRVKRSLILDDGRSKELHYSVRLYDLSELGKLLHEVGFRVGHVSGDISTPGAFFGPASPYIVVRAQRP